MQHQESESPEELGHQVSGFWYREMDFGNSPAAFEVLPDGHAEIIFHFGSGCSLLTGGQSQLLPSPFIVGLLKQPIYFEAKGRLQVLGIKCFPWAVFDLLRLSSVKGGVQSIQHPIAVLQPKLEVLLSAGQVSQTFQLLGDWLLSEGFANDQQLLRKVGQAISDSNGSLPVSSVAEAAHMTVRTLERKFKASSGHTVKDVSGLVRFEQARDRLWQEPDLAVTVLAHDLGYADQSHLNREFKRYSGLTAGAFARQCKIRKKELSGDFVAIVLSSS